MTTMSEALHTEGVRLMVEYGGYEDAVDTVYPISVSAWLKESNARLRSDDFLWSRAMAVLPDGEVVLIGSWTKVEAGVLWGDRETEKTVAEMMPDIIDLMKW